MRKGRGFSSVVQRKEKEMSTGASLARYTSTSPPSPSARLRPIGVRRRWRYRNSTSRRCCRYRRRWRRRYNIGRNLHWVTVLVPLLDMEAVIDVELEDDPTPVEFVVIVSALFLPTSGVCLSSRQIAHGMSDN
jgi:hypothetical protein